MKTHQAGAHRIKQTVLGLVLVAAGMVPSLTLAAAGPLPVELGETAHFALLAGSAISSTGGGTVNGDIGVCPAAGSTITGLTQAQVNGVIYTVNAAGPAGYVIDLPLLTAAKSDLTTAYNDARDRVPVPVLPFLNPGGGNIGGLTLVPGLYKFTSQALITGSDVTLAGGPDDVWIFQIATELIVGADVRKVILTGGAQARNVFWQVGTSATLGTFSEFKGTIMADQAIVIDTSSKLEGRALARIAHITFNGISANLPAVTNLQLTIVSEHGTGVRPAGTYTNGYGSTLANSMTGVETIGGTQYVGTGWSMIGNAPVSGSGTNVVMIQTNNAVLTWLWRTNYLLNASSGLNGSVSGNSNGFYAAGSSVVVTATPSLGSHFVGWTGNVSGPTNDAVQTMPMDQARSVVAHFAFDRAVQLTIVSAHGTGLPPVGTYTNGYGATLTNRVTGVETIGGTRYVAAGWNMTGNDPVSGGTTNMIMVQTNNAVLTWQWNTEYYLSLTAVNGSIINGTAGWKPADETHGLSPVADVGYVFDHWEVNTVNMGAGVPLTVLMNGPQDVVAVFVAIPVDEATWVHIYDFRAAIKNSNVGRKTDRKTNALYDYKFSEMNVLAGFLAVPDCTDCGAGQGQATLYVYRLCDSDHKLFRVSAAFNLVDVYATRADASGTVLGSVTEGFLTINQPGILEEVHLGLAGLFNDMGGSQSPYLDIGNTRFWAAGFGRISREKDTWIQIPNEDPCLPPTQQLVQGCTTLENLAGQIVGAMEYDFICAAPYGVLCATIVEGVLDTHNAVNSGTWQMRRNVRLKAFGMDEAERLIMTKLPGYTPFNWEPMAAVQ
jgi:hypothetical protein